MAAYEYIKYNTEEDDYVERAGAVEELTVTITLCEYRYLIRKAAENEMKIEQLANENSELEERVKTLSQAILAKFPDLVGGVLGSINEIFGIKNDAEEADADETARGI